MSFSIAKCLAQSTEDLTIQGVPNPRLDAEVLLAYVLGLSRAGLFARLHNDLPKEDIVRFHQLLHRRLQREPLQYITGVQEFWSLEFRVTPEVLIPRQETELVVETTLRLLGEDRKSNVKSQKSKFQNPSPNPELQTLRLLDIGTGSGCIAIALAKELPNAEVWATDISNTALTVAQDNAQQHNVTERLHFLQGDLFTPLQHQGLTFDLIVSNPPYIVHDDIPLLQPEVGNWEPHRALDGGSDGLDFYRRLLHESPNYLWPGGYLVLEIGLGQGAEVLQLARQQPNFTESSCLLDYEGRERLMITQKRS